MHSMSEVCAATDLSYEGLKFYCNQGLIPNVKRDKHNHRIFDDHDVAWIKSLTCLKKCGMSIAEMKEYLRLCLQGQDSIPDRLVMLERKKAELERERERIDGSLTYIEWKQGFYEEVLSGKTAYFSNLLPAAH